MTTSATDDEPFRILSAVRLYSDSEDISDHAFTMFLLNKYGKTDPDTLFSGPNPRTPDLKKESQE